ncbi:MAG TPA: hypothetical protein ENI62_06685 [Gammaproteobacteria bacterium]|nr:hypothetical protein [Gammaproteobacteria bacterium]
MQFSYSRDKTKARTISGCALCGIHASEALQDVPVWQQLLQAYTTTVDETSLPVEWCKHWIYVYSAGDITPKVLHRQRDIEATAATMYYPAA